MSLSQCNGQWRGDCHVISGLQVKTIVLSVVADTSGREKHLVENIVPVLACLQQRAEIKSVTVEGELLVGRSVAAALVSDTPLVVGMVTSSTVFQEIQRQFLAEFSGLDPLSVLEHFKVRLMPVVRERFMDRLPHLRQVREKNFLVRFLFCLFSRCVSLWYGGGFERGGVETLKCFIRHTILAMDL